MLFLLKAGQFFTVSSFFLSLFGFILSLSGQRGAERILRFLILPYLFSIISLEVALLKGDYTIKFVAEHSNSLLPMFYKISALWGGQEGSILLWGFILTIYSFFLSKELSKSKLSLSIVFLFIVFFSTLSAFISSPFKLLYPPPENGRELNPLLQHPGMVIHPIFLYLGLSGVVFPYAIYIGGGNYRRILYLVWGFLAFGVIIGGWWAYSELGWGGYWAWDPVENVSLIPLLTLTAFIHSSLIEDKFGGFKKFNISLISLSVILATTGTFLVRTGLFISVHSFVKNPELGISFLVLIFLITFISLWKIYEVKGTKFVFKSFFSRDMFIFLGTIMMILMWFAVVFGTIFPVIYQSFTDKTIGFGRPFFDKFFAEIGTPFLIFMSVGQSLLWSETPKKTMKERFLVPFIPSFLLFLFILLATKKMLFSYGIGVSIFGILVIVYEWISKSKKEIIKKRRFFAMLTHIGFFILSIGIISSNSLSIEEDLEIKIGEEINVDGYKIKFLDIENVRGKNYIGIEGKFIVEKDGKKRLIKSQKRAYFTWEEPTTEAGINWGIFKDIYISMSRIEGETAQIKFFVNYMVSFIWFGAIIMLISSILISIKQK